MPDPIYFPRIPKPDARALLAEYSTMGIEEVRSFAAIEHDHAFFYPSAPTGQHAPSGLIAEFQGAMRDIAKNHGYPASLTPKDRRKTAWDREVVQNILQVAPLIPAEASVEEVWSFLTLVVVPDVALWRWPNKAEKDDYERILGYRRNVFRRLWWRAFTLGPVANQIYEDEAVAILERTAIGGNRAVARMIAETHLRDLGDEGRRTQLMRDVMKRLCRLHAFVSFHSLYLDEVQSLIEESFTAARLSLRV